MGLYESYLPKVRASLKQCKDITFGVFKREFRRRLWVKQKKRDALALQIKENALAYGIGQCTPEEIDRMNILYASLEAMRRAYVNMHKTCELMLIDGNKLIPDFPLAMQAVVKGDARVPEISAASILAKTERDAQLYALDKQYPEYGFANHKGYPTAAHFEILQKLPLLSCYRMTYGPLVLSYDLWAYTKATCPR